MEIISSVVKCRLGFISVVFNKQFLLVKAQVSLTARQEAGRLLTVLIKIQNCTNKLKIDPHLKGCRFKLINLNAITAGVELLVIKGQFIAHSPIVTDYGKDYM